MSLRPHEIKTPEQLIQYLTETVEVVIHVPRVVLIQTVGVEAAQELLPELPHTIGVNAKRALELCLRNQAQSTPSKTTTTT